MKHAYFLTALFFISKSIVAQKPEVTTDKKNYAFDDLIEVVFSIDAKPDSNQLPTFDGLKWVSGPNTSSSMSVTNGETTYSQTLTYKLRPTKSGKLEINSPVYFINGKKIKAKSVKITVEPSGLSDEELKEKAVKEFIKDSLKPPGTMRLTFHDDMGFLEVYQENAWKVVRTLTAEELLLLKQMEK